MEVIHKIGRRKTAVARVYMKPGSGKVTINKKDLNEYFTTSILQYKVTQPFALLNLEGAYDLKVNVYGGGITGQAEAIRLAVSRALCEVDVENRAVLKPEGLLTRDPRMVERKKFGQKKLVRDSNSLNVNIWLKIFKKIKKIVAVLSLKIGISLASKYSRQA